MGINFSKQLAERISLLGELIKVMFKKAFQSSMDLTIFKSSIEFDVE